MIRPHLLLKMDPDLPYFREALPSSAQQYLERMIPRFELASVAKASTTWNVVAFLVPYALPEGEKGRLFVFHTDKGVLVFSSPQEASLWVGSQVSEWVAVGEVQLENCKGNAPSAEGNGGPLH